MNLSLKQGRWCVVLAALLWSTSGFFAKIITKETVFGLHTPPVEPMTVAFYRVLFAGLALLAAVRPRDVSFRPLMPAMVLTFAVMNMLFVSALTLGTAANAIFLQYTAPLWLFLASIWLLKEKADRRGAIALAVGMVGVAVIVVGGSRGDDMKIIGLALGSGVAYAAVLLFLRALRESSSTWLTVLNHLGAAAIIFPFAWRFPTPSGPQLAVLAVFGAGQMGLAYWFVARGLRVVSPQEAGTITLLEPILNPVWAYLVAGEVPTEYTMLGGAIIIAALGWRYWPRRR